jgi:hypothetical protein
MRVSGFVEWLCGNAADCDIKDSIKKIISLSGYACGNFADCDSRVSYITRLTVEWLCGNVTDCDAVALS